MEKFDADFGGKVNHSVHSGFVESLRKKFTVNRLSNAFQKGFPHPERGNFFEKPLVSEDFSGFWEKSHKVLQEICGKLCFFHTVSHSLWKRSWKIHKDAVMYGEYVWRKRRLSTAG